MTPSDEQQKIIDAPLGPIAVTACAGSGKTATAIRRLVAMRQLMGPSRGRVALLSFSNVAVDTFEKGYQQLASTLPDSASRRRVEVDTLDGFFTKHVLRPHAYRTMGASQAAYLVTGSEPFLNAYKYWRDPFPITAADVGVGFVDQKPIFYYSSLGDIEVLDQEKASILVTQLGRTGAYTHDLGRYWCYQTLSQQPCVLRALAKRYPQLLIDESQDLGMLHQAILELLMGAGVHVSLIGDSNQGIYGFAGADGTFLRTYHERPGVAKFGLTTNYRSLPPIIDLANLLSGRKDRPDRKPGLETSGAYFIGYKESELPALMDVFKAQIDALGLKHEDAVVLSRTADRAVKLAGGATIPGQGLVETFARASICRDQSDHLHDAFKLVCLGVYGLLKAPPNGLVAKLTGSPQEPWLRHLRRLLWGFTRDKAKGLPSSALLAKSQWHPLLLERIRALVKTIHTEFGIETADNLGNKLAKKGLDETPLKASADIAAGNRPGMRVETVHQVKGESIDAVLYVAKKPQVESLLAGVGSEEGRIGYVAVTRARNLFLLGVPNSAIKDLRGPLLDAGFQELAKAK